MLVPYLSFDVYLANHLTWTTRSESDTYESPQLVLHDRGFTHSIKAQVVTSADSRTTPPSQCQLYSLPKPSQIEAPFF